MPIYCRILLICTIICCASFPVFAQTKKVLLEPCEVPSADEGKKEKVLCGKYAVFENRRTKTGRQIELKIVVFPATGVKKSPDPFFYIPGGPGSSATEDAPFMVQANPQIRQTRDMVFVDQRGAGGSNHLDCPFFNPDDPQSYLEYFYPLDEVKRCRAELEKKSDLKLYTTDVAIDDFDEVRQALGYEKVNLLGISYGTRFVQAYLKRYSKNVRSAVFHGVSPTNQFLPGAYPQHTERALNGVIDDCLAKEPCRRQFPNLRDEVKTVLAQLLQNPATAELKHPKTGATVKVKLSRNLAGEAVRYMLYHPGAAIRIPLYLHLAAQGNYNPLAEIAFYFRRTIVASGGNGMFLSITCAEDLPWINVRESEKSGENTFLGNYRLKQQLEACALWTRAEIPKDYTAPTRSKVPVLILSGQWDPVTPPVYGDYAAKYLPNSLHLIVPEGGHSFSGMEGGECLPNVIADFVHRGITKDLKTDCFKNIRRRNFLLKLPE